MDYVNNSRATVRVNKGLIRNPEPDKALAYLEIRA